MNERQWELYRLSVVERWVESLHQMAIVAAIEHKLMVLENTQPREQARGAGAVNCGLKTSTHSR
jgi:hypothetical protein